MYVGDYTSGKVEIYDNTGNYIRNFNETEKSDQLRALARDRHNSIYTSDAKVGHLTPVRKFDEDGNFLDKFYDNNVQQSIGLAVDTTDRIYWNQQHVKRVLRRNNDLSNQEAFSFSAGNPITGLTVDNNNKIYIVATGNNKILILNEDGTLNYEFSSDTGKAFNAPAYIISNNQGKFYVSDTGNNRLVVLFDPTAWTEAGTAILGTLNLTEDLTLNNGYHLKVRTMDDTTSGSIAQSDGKLTITNNKTLTTYSGSSLETASLAFDNGHLIMNQDSSLNMPVTLNNMDNSFDMGGHTLSLAGVISGAGRLAKQGSGTLVLSRTNTYSGGTKLETGIISLANNSALGTGSLDMAYNTTLNLSNNISIVNNINLSNNSIINVPINYKASLQNLISNNASNLIKGGGGELLLGSRINHQGTTEVSEGVLSLDNASLGGDVTVASNARLRGTGHLLAALINNGTVAPGASPGIMQVRGNYIQGPGGVLEIYISPSESPAPGVDYSQLSVEGSANIAGSNLVVNAEDGNYSNGTRYNILTSKGGINGEFGNFTLNVAGSNSLKLQYDAHNVFLSFLGSHISKPYIDNLY